MPYSNSIALQPSDLVRLQPQPPATGAGWLLIDDLDNLHVADAPGGGVRYRRSEFELPPWDVTTQVTPGPADSEPRFAIWMDRRIRLFFSRQYNFGSGGTPAFDVWWTTSHDEGATFLTEEMLFPGGKHPTCNVGRDGEFFCACYLDGGIQALFQDTGDDDLDTLVPFTFLDQNGNPLAVADDSFHFAPGAEHSRSWELFVTVQGETGGSFWRSFDYPPNTWFRKA